MCMFCKQQVIGSLIVCGTGTVLPIISQCERCTGLPPTPLLLVEYYQCTVKPLYAIYDMEGWSMAKKTGPKALSLLKAQSAEGNISAWGLY